MNRIVEWVRVHWVPVILIPPITAFFVAYLFPNLAKTEPDIVYDINHKIENRIHSFTFTVRNEGSGNIKKDEFVELNLFFRTSIKSVAWYSVFSHKVIEEFCSGYKIDENVNGEKVFYRLNINQLAPEAELKFTIYSEDFLAKSPHFSYGSSNNINPGSCTADGTVYEKLCSGNWAPLNRFDVKQFYDQCKGAGEERCNCPLSAPPQ